MLALRGLILDFFRMLSRGGNVFLDGFAVVKVFFAGFSKILSILAVVNDVYENFLTRVCITREARFMAKKRLERRHKRSYYLISMMSLFVIMLSVLPNIFILETYQTQMLLMITIVNSVFIIITTLVDVSGNYSLQAYWMQKSGRELAAILNRLLRATDKQKSDPKFIEEVQIEYQQLLDTCPYDHDDVDYLMVRMYRPKFFPVDGDSSPERPEEAAPRKDVTAKFENIKNRLVVRYVTDRWWLPHMAMLLTSFLILYFALPWSGSEPVSG